MITTTPATDILNELARMQAIVHLTMCHCCKRPLNTYIQPGLRPTSATTVYGTCKNPRCSRFTITREINDLAGLTESDIAQFQQATVNS